MVNQMKIYEQLDEKTRRELGAKKTKPTRRRRKKRKEKLSDADLRYLMGTNRQIHKRVHGKVKRK